MMNDYQSLVKRLAQINEGASIVNLDVNAASDPNQGLKSVIVGIALSSGAQISATFQAPCYETLLDSLETFFNIQSQIVEQAIEQVTVMADTDGDAAAEMGPMDDLGSMGDVEYDYTVTDGTDEDSGELPLDPTDDEFSDDMVADTDDLEPEIGPDVDTDEARYSHNYSFRNRGTGLFQSLTGQQRIQKGALRAAKKKLSN